MTPEPPETEPWLRELRDGRPQALAALFQHYQARLRQMLRLRIDPRLAARVDVSDVLQEAYLDAGRQVEAYLRDPRVAFYVWLRGLTWERLLNVQRQHLGTQRRAVGREVPLPADSSALLVRQLLTGGGSPSEALLKKELRRRVQDAVARLRPDDREVILLRNFENLSNTEVAQALGLSAAAATMRYGRALLRLKEFLTPKRVREGRPHEPVGTARVGPGIPGPRRGGRGSQRLPGGRRSPDVEALAARHPAVAEQVRQLVPALAVLYQLGRESAGGLAVAPPAEALGQLGDFRIVREVGRGGMGVVYEAEQVSIGRRVALKVLPFAAALDERQLRRFRHEVQAAGQLHHQHIVPVYSVGHERGVHYYAMQFVDGLPLSAVIRELRGSEPRPSGSGGGSPLPDGRGSDTTGAIAALSTDRSAPGPAHFRTAARLGVQAAEALQHAHEQGVVHRDVKPANLLVDGRGHLWVTDFGLAQLHNDGGLTATGDLVGTLRYMSPEQALGGASWWTRAPTCMASARRCTSC